MPTAYPWKIEKTHQTRLRWLKLFKRVGMVLLIIGAIVFSPIALAVYLGGNLWFRNVNDSPRRAPIIVFAVSALALGLEILFKVNPFDGIAGMFHLLMAHDRMSSGEIQSTIVTYLLVGLPAGSLIASVPMWVANQHLEYGSRRYLNDTYTRLNWTQRLRKKRNMKLFKENKLTPENLELGVVQSDVLPWRRGRIGMIVGLAFKKIRHAFIIGGTGSGKTILATNYFAECIENHWAGILPDFKGAWKTEAILAAIAKENRVPFYSFWVSGRDTGFHYDPLDGPRGLPPVSVFLLALGFSTEGDSEHYTALVTTYLNNQFRALEEGLIPRDKTSESTFDVLWKTSDPKKFKDMLSSAAGKKQTDQAKVAKSIAAKIEGINISDLSGYRSRLNNVIDTVGEKMRPSKHNINLRDAVDEEAIVYFGLPSTGDKTVMRVIGSLIVRDVVSMIAEREMGGTDNVVPALFMPDEFSQLEDACDLLLEIIQQGRNSKIITAPTAQTLAAMSDTFVAEMLGNDPILAVMRASDLTDSGTLETLSAHFDVKPTIHERRDRSTKTDTFGTESQTISGSGMNEIKMEEPRITPGDIKKLDDHEFFAYMSPSPDQATLKKPRNRVRKDAVAGDIPTALTVSRDYILEAESDTSVADEMIALTQKNAFAEEDREAPEQSFDPEPEFVQSTVVESAVVNDPAPVVEESAPEPVVDTGDEAPFYTGGPGEDEFEESVEPDNQVDAGDFIDPDEGEMGESKKTNEREEKRSTDDGLW